MPIFFQRACLLLVLFALLLVPDTGRAETWGKLYIKVNQEGAIILIINNPQTFRQGMKLKPGPYIIKISKSGYDSQTKKITMVADKDVTLKVDLKRPEPKEEEKEEKQEESAEKEKKSIDELKKESPKKGKAKLFVEATPKDTKIRVLNIGPKFKQGIELKPGTYVVQGKRKGYKNKKVNATLVAGKNSTITLELEPTKETLKKLPGTLVIDITPKDATIKLLNIKPKFTQGMELKAGKYRVEASKENYVTQEKSIKISPNKEFQLDFTLKAEKKEPAVQPEENNNTEEKKEEIAEQEKEEKTIEQTVSPAPEPVAEPEKTKDEPQTATQPDEQTNAQTDEKADEKQDKQQDEIKEQTDEPKVESAQTETEPTSAPEKQTKPEEQPGTLTISTDQDVKLRVLNLNIVYKDGMELPPGMHVIEAIKDGYPTRVEKVEIKAGKKHALNISFVQKEVQKEQVEETKKTEQVLESTQETAATTDQDAQQETPKVVDQDTSTEKKSELPPVKKGKERLYVDATPKDAQVRVLNIAKKYVQGMELGPGKYTVEVRKKGLKKITRKVVITPGQHLQIAVDLTQGKVETQKTEGSAEQTEKKDAQSASDKRKGKLFVEADVTDVKIYLPEIKPKFTQGMELKPGTYAVEISKEGYSTQRATVKILPGKKSTIKIKFASATKKAAPKASKKSQAIKKIEAYLEVAAQSMQAGQFDQARELLTKALQEYPHSASLFKARGDAYKNLKNSENAMADYNQAIKLSPEFGPAYAERGTLFAEQKDTQSACYDFWKACSYGKCKEIGKAKQEGLCK